MTARHRLPNRRASLTLSFLWEGMKFTATVSRHADDRLAEIFLTNGKVNSQADSAARDSAVVANLALQYGTQLETIQHALLHDPQGCASSPLGVALDLIAEEAPM